MISVAHFNIIPEISVTLRTTFFAGFGIEENDEVCLTVTSPPMTSRLVQKAGQGSSRCVQNRTTKLGLATGAFRFEPHKGALSSRTLGGRGSRHAPSAGSWLCFLQEPAVLERFKVGQIAEGFEAEHLHEPRRRHIGERRAGRGRARAGRD